MFMRCLAATLILASLAVLPGCGPSRRERERMEQERLEAARRAFPPELLVNQRVAERLKQPISVNFQGTTLSEAVDYLRNVTGLNFVVNWNVLQATGIEPTQPVRLQLINVATDHVLRVMLGQLPTPESNPLGYDIVEGVVTVSTQRDLILTTETRVYDVRDLLSALRSPWDQQGVTLDRTQRVEQLRQLVQDTVGRKGDWEAHGGVDSSVRELNGNLIIKTTPENHREVMDLLTKLRETMDPRRRARSAEAPEDPQVIGRPRAGGGGVAPGLDLE